MDNASSDKSASPCFKQDQIALFVVQRRSGSVPTGPRSLVPRSSRSAVPNSNDFLIVIGSESTIALTSERLFSCLGIRNHKLARTRWLDGSFVRRVVFETQVRAASMIISRKRT
jgi:hypothetical protein